ncbi:hypothetical protein E1B28_001096 [Marasmius oreades]|uniref:DUF6699 domain-containing protein n=1 Tax=Marasmius oreades TaxID=181124 RepID=A0A9P7V2S6_9AGAR|nr:uncharacterized protein E1B28_001096 [Marasmius oreades]KAG7099230.1 hypothetical protein E1B28_001096 [Marasmius oreades]
MNPWSNPYYLQHPPYYNPHIYYPPGYTQPQPINGPPPFHSKKWPNLHPALAADATTIRYDLKKKPQEDILGTTFLSIRHSPAMAYSVTNMRIISRSFPWAVDIVSAVPITCQMVFDALYAALQHPLADSEWGLAIGDKKLKESIEKSAKSRADKDGDKALKRIDWLGDGTHFKGLEKIEEFEKARLLPGKPAVGETWVVKLTT